MVDKIIKIKNRTKRVFCSFYTESDPILEYMVKQLNIANGDDILEPCAGDGIFIEKILDKNIEKEINIELIDLNPRAVKNLNNEFSNYKNIKIRKADTLLDSTFDLFEGMGGKYTKIIGNPPYGAWQSHNKRSLLKKKYKDYAKETYTLFIRRCVNLLKGGGRLVFIVPDTFLALNLHKNLRKKILEETTIEELLLLPSKFFPGVNFGYANLCIISLKRIKPSAQHRIKIVYLKKDINNLYEITKNNYNAASKIDFQLQSEILNRKEYPFLLNSNPKLRNLIVHSEHYLGDIADCVTGFYSGNNKRFIFKNVEEKFIEKNPSRMKNVLEGLTGSKKYVPVLKGRGSPVFNDTVFYIKWGKDSVKHYKSSEKARFQNSKYYFKEGIGVPMVKTKKIKAFLLKKRLFDQSVVGIFPKNNKYLNYLLLFLNSETANKLIHAINHTSNNSANYLKRLPLEITDGDIVQTNKIMKNYKRNKDMTKILKMSDSLFSKRYKIS